MSARTLPPNPSLNHLKKQARALLKAHQSGDAEAISRLRASVPQLANASEAEIIDAKFALHDAQRILAREYGFENWADLLRAVTRQSPNTAHANAEFSIEELIAYFAAIRDQDLDILQQCLDANASLTEARINVKSIQLKGESFAIALRDEPLTEQSSTAIHLAANSFLDYAADSPKKSLEVVQLLLDYDADPNAIGFNGNTGHCTPIVIASWEGGVKKMRLLLEAGADVSGDQGIAALSTAANHASIDRFDLLLEYGAPSTPWMLVRAGLTDRVVAQVDTDPTLLKQRDEQGYLLLQAAALRMNRDAGEGLPEAGRAIAAALVERGAEVDIFTAAALNDENRLRAILQADPTLVHARFGDGRTPVNLAVLAGSNATLSVLLQTGADPQNDNALAHAARMDDTAACRLLIEHGAEVNDKVVLEAAWRNQDPACLELILTNGGNPDAKGGRGALHWVSASNPAAVQLLINAGADVNARAPAAMNNTALHHAAANADSTARLLAAGADPTLQNDNKESPLDIADRIGAQDVADLLRKALKD